MANFQFLAKSLHVVLVCHTALLYFGSEMSIYLAHAACPENSFSWTCAHHRETPRNVLFSFQNTYNYNQWYQQYGAAYGHAHQQ